MSFLQRSEKTLLLGIQINPNGLEASRRATQPWFLLCIAEDTLHMRMNCFKCFEQGALDTTTWYLSEITQINGYFWRDTRACQPACFDWSEAALIGLYFALKEDSPVIWMLNPLELNA